MCPGNNYKAPCSDADYPPTAVRDAWSAIPPTIGAHPDTWRSSHCSWCPTGSHPRAGSQASGGTKTTSPSCGLLRHRTLARSTRATRNTLSSPPTLSLRFSAPPTPQFAEPTQRAQDVPPPTTTHPSVPAPSPKVESPVHTGKQTHSSTTLSNRSGGSTGTRTDRESCIQRLRAVSEAHAARHPAHHDRAVQTRIRRSLDGTYERPNARPVQAVTVAVERRRCSSPPTAAPVGCLWSITSRSCSRRPTAMLSSCPPSTTRTRTAEDWPFSQLGHEEDPTNRSTCGLIALVVRGRLCRPPAGPPTTVSFCSVHPHNVVAKQRNAATSLLQRLHAHDRPRRGLHWRRLQHSGQRFPLPPCSTTRSSRHRGPRCCWA